ncbi:serine/threonine protein kinase [Micromonospora chalcea]|uniref:serine/threonine protein kinase n=1 Tax=Micromonospora chalcea TaxID=1874 RepID=UPI00157D555B|nr:serine/threonine protein kinase [Micromonospora chalcea]
MRTEEAIRLVTAARTDADLFGADEPARRYRELVGALHPDRLGAADPLVRAAAAEALVTVTTRWRTPAPMYAGDVADLHDHGDGRLLKVARHPGDNDLMAREARALRRIAERGDAKHLAYVPRLVDSYPARDPSTGVQRQVNELVTVPGLRSLDDVRRAYPDGLDPRDAAWMWRRLLVALGLAHRAGVVHGAVLPRHVLIEPDAHGLVLVDWCFSAEPGGLVPALVPGHEDWYPPEVAAKRQCGPGTDIAMAARCMTWLMADRAPRELRAFAAGCQGAALATRPDDAWRLLRELDEVLHRLYGPRTFRPFTLNP